MKLGLTDTPPPDALRKIRSGLASFNAVITCDTSSFQALPFYQAQGFEIVGRLQERPPQYESYFLQKHL